jgi:hypothetical protein
LGEIGGREGLAGLVGNEDRAIELSVTLGVTRFQFQQKEFKESLAVGTIGPGRS